MHRPIPLLGLICLGFALQASAADPAPFAVFPPETVATFRAVASRPEAMAVIKDATDDLNHPPTPLARLHTEGTLPHQGIYDESLAAAKNFDALLDLAVAYRLTDDPRFLQQADAYFAAWFPLYHSSANPIDETGFDRAIFAYDLTRHMLRPATQTAFNGFLTELAGNYLAALEDRKKMGDNWQSHRTKLAVLSSYSLGDAGLMARAERGFFAQTARNILADASVLDFHKRDALHYVTYDLEPLSVACLAAKAHGQDWFHKAPAGGASVAQAVDWLLPYARGEKAHEEFVHSVVSFDAIRQHAGVPGFSGPWERVSAIRLLALDAALEPARRADLDRLLADTGKTVPGWMTCVFFAK